MDAGELLPTDAAPPTVLGSTWPPPRRAWTAQDDAFIAGIREAPDDDTLRLIYADWLTDQDDPRGLFIHLDLAILAETDPMRMRLLLRDRKRLLQRYEEYWSPGDRVTAIGGFTRGFLESVTMTPRQVIEHGNVVFAREPIHELRLLYDATTLNDSIHRCPCLDLVQRLHLRVEFPGSPLLAVLLHLPTWPRLRALTLTHADQAPVTFQEVQLLMVSRCMPGLRTLRLAGLSTAGLEILLDAPGFALERLEVPGSQRDVGQARSWDDESPAIVDVPSIGREGLELLARHPAARSLTYLDASHNPVSLTLDLLAESPHLPNLRTIRIGPREEIDLAAWRAARKPAGSA